MRETMDIPANRAGSHNQRAFLILTGLVTLFVLFTILQDSLYAGFHSSSFYLSESFLFTSFWWIFLPLLYGQYLVVRSGKARNLVFMTLSVLAPFALHLFAFPALVWLISKLFYENTFWFWRTFGFGLSAHLYQLVFFYTVPLFVYRHFTEKALAQDADTKAFRNTFVVSEGNKRMTISAADILYLTANSPYINIHHRAKKYLYSETLKSVEDKLNSTEFVRIHKSAIVNIKYVKCYTSRLNGDYDLTMLDGTQLRVSRNYAGKFKATLRQVIVLQ